MFNLVRLGPNAPLENMISSNIIALENILIATKNINYSGFVHLGSGLEYGQQNTTYIETLRDEPNTEYGLTKAISTMRLKQFAKANNKPILIFRVFQIYGPNDKTHRLIPTAITSAIKDKKMKLTEKASVRDWIYIDDVIDSLLSIQDIKIIPGELINIGSGKAISNYDIVKIIETICQKKINIEKDYLAPREFDSEKWEIDITKSKKMLNWEPKTSIQEGLRQIIEQYNG